MNIKTISHIQIYLDGRNIPEPFHPDSMADAVEFAVNKVLNGRTSSKIVETIELFPVPGLDENQPGA